MGINELIPRKFQKEIFENQERLKNLLSETDDELKELFTFITFVYLGRFENYLKTGALKMHYLTIIESFINQIIDLFIEEQYGKKKSIVQPT
jgi:hypothetical protein